VFGWHDDDRVLVAAVDLSSVVLIDVETGTEEPAPLVFTGAPLGIFPVGDGNHVIVATEAGLLLTGIGNVEQRSITLDCVTSPLVGAAG